MDSGSVKVDGNEISGLNADELSEYRRANLGFIFQFYNLVPNLTVKENIEICQFLTEDPLDMEELLDTLGLTEHQDKFSCTIIRWTAAAMCNCKGVDQESKAASLRRTDRSS